MTAESSQSETIKPDKYCDQCGQKNFRPNRSLKELFVEFVEDWLGYDSKIYKTAAKLAKPAALSLDYFNNSHHKSHYITPIRLYLFLSIIFFLMTKFGGLSLTELNLNDVGTVKTELTEVEKQEVATELNNAIKETDSEIGKQVLTSVKDGLTEAENKATKPNEISSDQGGSSDHFSISDDKDFRTDRGCEKPPEDYFTLWPQWLDRQIDNGMREICDSYKSILYLPEAEQSDAKKAWGLSLAQNAIELIPQTYFLSLPLLALALALFYFLSKRLYVEHLVLLMHSHSFIFAITLFYLGWYQVAKSFPILQAFPMGSILWLIGIVYLYLSQKWFYQRGWWATLWRFCLFGLVYIMLTSMLLLIGTLIGIIIGA